MTNNEVNTDKKSKPQSKQKTKGRNNKNTVDMASAKGLKTAIFALGGLGEIGKNTYCIEQGNDIIIIDAGIKFPSDDLFGVEYVIPDYAYLQENIEKIRGLVITHGHEDHIGGIPFMIQKLNIPVVYAPAFACSLIKKKLDDRKLSNRVKISEFNSDTILKLGKFTVSFFAVNHSIPDSYAIVVDTDNGRIVTTGDFKFDLTPVGQASQIQKMASIGSQGVSVLMSDSTNSEVEDFTMSEKKVSIAINELFVKSENRIIIATFASNVYRVQQIIEAAVKNNRKIAVFGRSMENVVEIGRKQGLIKCPDSSLVTANQLKSIPAKETLIVCTGSQGEPLAALSRIANGTHKFIKIQPNDTVVFSSSPIPGNALSVGKVVNSLFRAGANVITNSVISDIHTSGHAAKEEQKLMLQLLKPKFFMPVHGEYRMLKMHAETAHQIGMAKENTFVLANGDKLVLENNEATIGNRVQADAIYVDGNDISGISTAVLRDREILSNDGLVSVIVTIDSKTNRILSKPQILSRGFIYLKDNSELIAQAERIAYDALEETMKERATFSKIKESIRNSIGPYLYQKTKRNPIIVPVIMNKN